MIIGIDPGAKGGIAYSDYDKNISAKNMPSTPKDIYEYLKYLNELAEIHFHTLFAVMERAGFHRAGNNASASCTFARHCGHLEMALVALGIPFTLVQATQWQKVVCGALPKDKTARKNAIKAQMQALYPRLKVTKLTGDALAILTYGLKIYGDR